MIEPLSARFVLGATGILVFNPLTREKHYMTLLLSRSEIDGLVALEDVIDAVEMAHADISRGNASQPAPLTLSLASGSATFLPMAALADRQGLATVKFLADMPNNRAAGLPR